ncbi:hypothetical protein, partial [Burkholderia pseudomallei]|uniref:hypothetical protein n=1 Tax=Burkholderia pseudomallei TaxID=28450 RepID=UPI001CC2A60F
FSRRTASCVGAASARPIPPPPRSRFSVFLLFCFASPIGTACVRFAAFNLSAARSVADTISR